MTMPSDATDLNRTYGRRPEEVFNSHQVELCPPIDSLPLAIVSGVVATATILANTLVIVAILRGSSHFQRPIYWVIIHLSFADLIVGLMLLWNYCVASLLNIGNSYTSLLVVFCIWVSSEASSTIGFVLLAVDRYVQIFHKHFHRTYATRVTVGICIALTWTFSIGLYSIAPMLGWSCMNCTCPESHYMHCSPLTECSQVVPPFKKNYSLTIAFFLCICIPIPVFIYGTIFVKVRNTAPLVRNKRRRHDMRLTKTLSVILLVFICTLCPVAILLCVDYAISSRNEQMIGIAFYIFVLAFLNSLANPLLYIWRMTPIRSSIKKMLHLGPSSRREFTSVHSENRSPLPNRHGYNGTNGFFVEPQNNNKPRGAMLCLRHIKKGKYNSKTSTPLSDRACNNHCQENDRISRDLDRELESGNVDENQCLDDASADKQANVGNCVETEL